MSGTEIFVGLTKRTNEDGAKAVKEAFREFPVHTINLSKFSASSLHLKSACSMCGPGAIAVGGPIGKFIQESIVASGRSTYQYFYTEETAAANCIYLNDVLIRRHEGEFPASVVGLRAIDAYVEACGGTVTEIEADELAKVDGALTCCALLVDI